MSQRSPRSAARLLLAAASLGASAILAASVAARPTSAGGLRADAPVSLFARALADETGAVRPLIRLGGVSGYSPQQIRANYNLGALYKAGLYGSGRVIGIVDVYGSPTIRKDLATFDAHFGLVAPPSFKIIQPAGRVPPFNPADSDMEGWAGETTLDVEWAHAIAPGAAIVLAETPVDEVEGTSGFAQIVTAEKYLMEHERVAVISQSFAATEETFPREASLMALRGAYTEAETRGVTVVAGSGDAGASGVTSALGYYGHRVVAWPASDPLVTAVGGTDITLNSAGHATAPVQVWNETLNAGGGGVSEYFPRPSWQQGVSSIVGKWRGIPDVSMTAACAHGSDVYMSFPGSLPGFYPVCGTSLATPIFAGVVAMAAQLHGRALGLINPLLYQLGSEHAAGFVDVTRGNNSVVVPVGGKAVEVKGYTATKGYDLASGWGTINAAALVSELAGKPLSG